ncbi:hypothetical protein M1466_01035 [Candidatus Dependentiae bacterium]|nr:hypothetical protein [Candidatus Dependentiae bacterium]
MLRYLMMIPLVLVSGCLKKSSRNVQRSISSMDRFVFQRDWVDIGMPVGACQCIAHSDHHVELLIVGSAMESLIAWYRRELMRHGWDIAGTSVADDTAMLVAIKPTQALVVTLTEKPTTSTKEQQAITVAIRRCLATV